ncbi:uncharacterized protein M6B38_287785 [Iris pallida]|uniref:Uncharacterized protein n=1 Tax=Iris pallida TaxID=29817 RepID=A0AAX6HY03_IRIPA|nr:uncharacterized protein M6B38_287785 [Iris pallida]
MDRWSRALDGESWYRLGGSVDGRGGPDRVWWRRYVAVMVEFYSFFPFVFSWCTVGW